MDFDEAIKAHAIWKMRLSAYVRHPDKSVDPNVLATDTACLLGKWIHGEGSKFSSFHEYGELKAAHAKFHLAAAEIARRADAGECVDAEVVFEADSPYSKASSEVTQLIIKLKNRCVE